MSGAKKLTARAARTAPVRASVSDAVERRTATLSRNDLIAGNEEIVARVIGVAEAVTYHKGTKLIEQGASDDCVYFIIAGSVEVRIDNRHIDDRSAPQTVGEMGAKKAGAPRTADVIVKSNTLDALVLSGSEFRRLMSEFPVFSRNLDDYIDELSRQKIAQLGAKKRAGGLSWPAMSGIAGLVAGMSAAVVALMATDSIFRSALVGLGVGFVVFVGILLANPMLRYRNLASAAGYALIAWIAYGTLSFGLTVDGNEAQLPLIMDFSVQTGVRLGGWIFGCVALLVLAWIGGHFDLKLRKSDRQ